MAGSTSTYLLHSQYKLLGYHVKQTFNKILVQDTKPQQSGVIIQNRINMLNYSKMILKKVSFNYFLFRKELYKAISNVNKEDLQNLRNWCFLMFGATYGMLITEAFKNT